MQNITVKDLLEAGIHFGHLTRFRNPKMSPYLYGVRNKINIINLDKTLPKLKNALSFLTKIGANGGKVLFVGTKKAACEKVEHYAKEVDMPYVSYRWLGGMLTNYKTIKQSIRRLKELEKKMSDGSFAELAKKEILSKQREIAKLEQSFGGIKEMSGLPDALCIIDAGHEKVAIQEANRLKIPVIVVVDSNHSPDNIDYVIPGNDDAQRAIDFYLRVFAEAIREGKASQIEEFKPLPENASLPEANQSAS